MNVSDAAYATVHDYPGGSESLAPRMGISAAVLRNKVNPNNDRNCLTLEEADEMMAVSNDFQVLQALAATHGFGLVALDAAAEPPTVISQLLQLGMAEGELAHAIHDAIADQLISSNEAAHIASAGLELQRVLLALLNRLSSATTV